MNTIEEAVKHDLGQVGISIIDAQLVGSTYIYGSTPEGSDVDYLVLVSYKTDVAEVFLNDEGWSYGGSSARVNDKWGSWTKQLRDEHGDLVKANLLMTNDADYYERWVQSAEACKFLVMQGVKLTKGQVHGLHEIVMDDADADSQHHLRNY
jgi:hypothetical protein